MTARRREVASRHDQEFGHAAIPLAKLIGLQGGDALGKLDYNAAGIIQAISGGAPMAVPEPGTLTLLTIGLVGTMLRCRSRFGGRR